MSRFKLETAQPVPTPGAADLATLYPETLAADMVQLRTLEHELIQLRALESGAIRTDGGGFLHRGTLLPRRQLLPTLRGVESDLGTVCQRLQAHDLRCRSLHRAAAQQLGLGWDAYLDGLLAALHYADHTVANLRDWQGLLSNTVGIATATRKVSKAGIERILNHGNGLQGALDKVYQQAKDVQLDATLLQRLAIASWADTLGELKLPGVHQANIGDWLKVVDSWVNHTADTCAALRTHALEQLLVCEEAVATHLREGTSPAPACDASRFPADYDTLLEGSERPRQTRLGLWGRFQTADGFFPTTARLLVAGGILATVLGFGGRVGNATVVVYNGLARPVVVHMGAMPPLEVAAGSRHEREVDAGEQLHVEAHTTAGELIERFDAQASSSFGQYIYNVASAAPLVEWTATYGNAAAQPEHELGAPRWSASQADHLFTDPPRSISTKGGGGSRLVLASMAALPPQRQFDVLHDASEQMRLAQAHARWDALNSQHVGQWLSMLAGTPDFDSLLATRLKEAPQDPLLLRLELDSARANMRTEVCKRHQAMAADAPGNVDLEYIALRCQPNGPELEKAFVAGHERHPAHGWFAFAAGHARARAAQWREALPALAVAHQAVPMLADSVAVDMVRIQRLLQQDLGPKVDALSKTSESLRQRIALETGKGLAGSPYLAYSELAVGRVVQAVQLARAEKATEARLLRLAAVSDGATPAMLARVKALPAEQGVDGSTVWASLGLAAREEPRLAEFKPALQYASPQDVDAVLHFAAAAKSGASAADAERWLSGLTPELRGHGYSVGVIVLGAKAPLSWRERAKRLLFASERPYFS